MLELATSYFVPSAVIILTYNGPEVASTTHWDSAEAANGFAILSYNDGMVHLLVPPLLECHLPDMAEHVRDVVLTRGRFEGVDDVVEILFDDATEMPFALNLDPKTVIRRWTVADERCGPYRFAIYTRDRGKFAEFTRCWLRSARQLPCLLPWLGHP